MAKTYDVVLLPGDGIGREIATQARRVLDRVQKAFKLSFAIDEIPCGGQYFLEHGRDWPEGSEARCHQADVILLGAGVLIVEYLCNLRSLTQEVVELVVAPLKIHEGDGAPARVFAIEETA